MASGEWSLREVRGRLAANHFAPLVRAITGGIVLALITGIWACLWVPPWPIF